MARLTTPRSRQRGLAILEMALILPLLFLLIMGVIEYGWLFFKNQQVSAVARSACRYGITAPATTAETLALCDTLMTQADLDASGYTKTSTPCEVLAGTFVTVTVTVPYANIKLTGFPLPLPTNLIGETTMAKEGPP
jgi:Flp pilus assembly protein TadG